MKLSVYEVLLSPLVSEKATMISEQNKVVFKVHKNATKLQVSKAIEAVYKTKPVAVNIINTLGKTKRFRGVIGRRNHEKKAIVTMPADHKIEIVAGG